MWKGLLRGWSGPPLLIQILALLVGALVVAQLVTLLLTLVLPPEPPSRYDLADIAARLADTPAGIGARPLDRIVQTGPPDLSHAGWLVSERSRTSLAALLHVPRDRVALGFYTRLPVGGIAIEPPPGNPRNLPVDARAAPAEISTRQALSVLAHRALREAAVVTGPLPLLGLAQVGPGGPPGGGPLPGGGFPGGGFPGGGFPGGSLPGGRGLPGGFPSSTPRDTVRPSRDQVPRVEQRAQDMTQGPRDADQSPAIDPHVQLPSVPQQQQGGAPPLPALRGAGRADALPPVLAPVQTPILLPSASPPAHNAAPRLPSVHPTPTAPARSPAAPPRPTDGTQAAAPRTDVQATQAPVTGPARTDTAISAPTDRPIPVAAHSDGLFGIASSPFVEGDFVAAVKLADGRWAVVSPRPEGFPNSWQRRVLAWFCLSLLLVAPIAWIFARRIVRPLRRFAQAAEALGRDPSATILPLNGPAEVGRAAHAFNLMQSRLRSFVDDRTAMVGAISHDLRTPLTRLRFRIEDVPEEQHAGLLAEITEMEAMISSVIDYIRDASTPNLRERLDLADLLDDVVEDVVMTGGDACTISAERAPVEVDALGIRRVLDNLLANAVKYGQRARIALRVEDSCAIADIVDDGPGIPEEEIDRVFEPFYRSEAARASDREGSGLGLAVCRSITRAHGGDVTLFRSTTGFVARVSIPLAFEPERQFVA